jgi:hypothetical protein
MRASSANAAALTRWRGASSLFAETVVRKTLMALFVGLLIVGAALYASAGDVSSASALQPLRIRNAKLQPMVRARANEPRATLLKFDLINRGVTTVDEVTFRLSVQERPTQADSEPHVRVRPFIVHGRFALEPGYTANVEMLLRNFDGDCDCVPKIEIVPESAAPN